MVLLKQAFGEGCAKDSKFFSELLADYCSMSLKDFSVNFIANAKSIGVKLKFATTEEAQLFQAYIRCAYLVVSTRFTEVYVWQSLTQIHNYTIQTNIFVHQIPFKMFLPVYWYTSRKFFLTNSSPVG